MAKMTEITNLTADVKSFTREKEVDLVGIASVDSYEEALEEMRPRYYIPDAQAVICLALQVPKPIVKQVVNRTTPYPYARFGIDLINDELDTIANQLSRFLAQNQAFRLKEELGTKPRVYYLPGHGQDVGRSPYQSGLRKLTWPAESNE